MNIQLILHYSLVACSALLCWVGAVVFHEIGHVLYFKRVLKRNIGVYILEDPRDGWTCKVGTPADYNDINTAHLKNVYLSGIVAGLPPLIYVALIFPITSVLLPLYFLWGCRHDIKNIMRLSKCL